MSNFGTSQMAEETILNGYSVDQPSNDLEIRKLEDVNLQVPSMNDEQNPWIVESPSVKSGSEQNLFTATPDELSFDVNNQQPPSNASLSDRNSVQKSSNFVEETNFNQEDIKIPNPSSNVPALAPQNSSSKLSIPSQPKIISPKSDNSKKTITQKPVSQFEREMNNINQYFSEYFIQRLMEGATKNPQILEHNAIINADTKQCVTFGQLLKQMNMFESKKEILKKFLMKSEGKTIHAVLDNNASDTEGGLKTSASSGSFGGSYENLLEAQGLHKQQQQSMDNITTSASTESFANIFPHPRPRKVVGLFLTSFLNISSLALCISAAGFKVCFLSPMSSPKQLKRMIAFARVSIVFTTQSLIPKLAPVLGHSSPVTKIVMFGTSGNENFTLQNELLAADPESFLNNNKSKRNNSKVGSNKNTSGGGNNRKSMRKIDNVPMIGSEDEEEDDESGDEGSGIPDQFIDEFDQEQIQQQEIQKELEVMITKRDKMGLPSTVTLIKSETLFKVLYLDSANAALTNEESIETKANKLNEIAFIFFSGGRFIGLTHKNMVASMIQTKFQKANDYEPEKRLCAAFYIDFYTVMSFRLYLIETLLEFGTIVSFEYLETIKSEITNPKASGEERMEIQQDDLIEQVEIVEKKLDLLSIFKKLAYWEVDTLYVIPNNIHEIIECRDIYTQKLGLSLQNFISSSDYLAKSSLELLNRQFKKINLSVNVKQVYGCSEACGILSLQTDQEAEKDPTLAGSLIPGIELKMLKLDNKGFGEFAFKGPNITKYSFFMNNRQEQNEYDVHLMDVNGEKCIWVGDKGKIVDDQLFILSRVKDVVKSNGHTVNEFILEKLLKKHDMIEDACVMAERVDQGYEVVKAYIVRSKGGSKKKKRYEDAAIESKPSFQPKEPEELPNSPKLAKFNGFNPNLLTNSASVDSLEGMDKQNLLNAANSNSDEDGFNEYELDQEGTVDFFNDDSDDGKYDSNYQKLLSKRPIQQTKEKSKSSGKDSGKLSEKDLEEYLKSNAWWNSYDKIHKFYFVKQLPKDANGKVLKSKLVSQQEELKGTLFSTFFSFVSSNFGVGTLGLSYAVMNSGFIVGLFETILFAVFMVIVTKISVDASAKSKKKTLQDLTTFYLGYFMSVVLQISTSISCFGCCVTYCIVMTNSLIPIVKQFIVWFPALKYIGLELFTNKIPVLATIGVVVLFPVTLFPDITFLQYPAQFSNIALTYLILFLVIQGAILVVSGRSAVPNFSQTPPNGLGQYWFFNFSLNGFSVPNFLITFPMICGCYAPPTLALPIMAELKSKTRLKNNALILAVCFIAGFVYTTVALFGTISFGPNVKDDILLNFENSDIFAMIARFAMTFVVLFCFCLLFFVYRANLKTLLFPKLGNRFPYPLFLLITIPSFFVCIAMGMVFQSISILLGFLGAFSTTFVFFFIPGLLAWKIYKSWFGKVICIILLMFGTFQFVGGLASSISTLILTLLGK